MGTNIFKQSLKFEQDSEEIKKIISKSFVSDIEKFSKNLVKDVSQNLNKKVIEQLQEEK